ncbi:hypothetical protein HPB50_015017 [Hyalomma asiaticum]|uniref:Uncharacterized protein n=1 Tax=Hyalomma asiaticum TaxID=266040 RepID=A0ACB7SES1_HYAAI|nr:hypothetical protein HPB50_015017 [Hyalomma asiaticum]
MQSAAVPNSNAMEREELVRTPLKLESLGIKVQSVTTDRHPGVESYFRKERPDVQHYFDAWHVAKGLRKKLMAASRSCNCAAIQLWIHSIVKHLYFVAAAGGGDGNLIVSMWCSLLNHICNRHTNYDGPFRECLHEPLLDKAWMTRESPALQKLQAIVENSLLLGDIQKLSPAVQTFSLESLNSLLIRFTPKSVAYSASGSKARTQLAVLHFNENFPRQQAEDRSGRKRWKRRLRRARKGHYTARKIKEEATFGYVQEILEDVVGRVSTSSHKKSSTENPPEPRKFLTDDYEVPPMEDIIAAHTSRFSGGST